MRVSYSGIDLGHIKQDERRNLNSALGIVAENALSDCERYVPYETGALRRSGRTVLSDGKAAIEWGGDSDTARYARRQYYDKGLHHTTSGTCAEWARVCSASRKTAWEGMFRKALSGGMR
jgi:hypothetical protein